MLICGTGSSEKMIFKCLDCLFCHICSMIVWFHQLKTLIFFFQKSLITIVAALSIMLNFCLKSSASICQINFGKALIAFSSIKSHSVSTRIAFVVQSCMTNRIWCQSIIWNGKFPVKLVKTVPSLWFQANNVKNMWCAVSTVGKGLVSSCCYCIALVDHTFWHNHFMWPLVVSGESGRYCSMALAVSQGTVSSWLLQMTFNNLAFGSEGIS